MAEMCGNKCDSLSTSDALSRENSLSSLPETECEWPETDCEWPEPDSSIRRPSTPVMLSPPVLPTGAPGQIMSLTASQPVGQTTFFQVAYQGGVEVRAGPFSAPQTGLVLNHNEVFAVKEEIVGLDGIVYLCLADGRGWVFDDTSLMPQDPSVVRCTYTPPQASSLAPCAPVPPPQSPAPAARAEVVLPPPPTMPATPPPRHGEILASTPMATPAPMVGKTVQVQKPAGELVAAPQPVSWFRVTHITGISLRSLPSIRAPLTGALLPYNETFPVAEEVHSPDGRVYLRLCDGRGWAFDDSALMPHDPSVKRGSWAACHSAGWQLYFPPSFQEASHDGLQNRRRRLYPQPRGKRGGKRCSRRKQAAAAAAASATAATVSNDAEA